MVARSNATSSADLAARRTMMAAERTLMAWIRTSMGMISFGFTIGKLGDALSSADIHLFGHTTDIAGVAYFLVIVGTLALMLAAVQYRVDIAAVSQQIQRAQSVAFIVAILLSVLGLLVFADLATRF